MDSMFPKCECCGQSSGIIREFEWQVRPRHSNYNRGHRPYTTTLEINLCDECYTQPSEVNPIQYGTGGTLWTIYCLNICGVASISM